MKYLRLVKVGFVGVALITISTVTRGQIETKFEENLENAKKTNGTEFFEDGTIKLKINTEMLEHFYNGDYEDDETSWSDLVNNSEIKSFAHLWYLYRVANENENGFADIRKDPISDEDSEIIDQKNKMQDAILADKDQDLELVK